MKSDSVKVIRFAPVMSQCSGFGGGKLNCREVHWIHENTLAEDHCDGSTKEIECSSYHNLIRTRINSTHHNNK